MPLQNLYITIPVGQSVRDFLILGTVHRLLDLLPDFHIVVLTPSYNIPEFLELCPKHERFLVRRMELPIGSRNWRLTYWRKKLHSRAAVRVMLEWELRRLRLPEYLASTFQALPPSLVVSTHPLLACDYDVVMWARRLRVQTLGIVKSWDNMFKGLSTHSHLLSVWNPVNKEEAVQLLGYCSDEVEVNGSSAFDMYYDPAYSFPRHEAFASLALDPSRPVITLATAGILDKGFYGRDETHLVEDILRMIGASEVLKGTQLVIRLHPTSRLEFFWKYWHHPSIKFSFASYLPGLMWCPTREDLIEQTNLLRHSDVIVTPASSWVLEAAIFDTPTVVPVYSDIQPAHATALFDSWTLARHYKPLVENKWVPITRSYDETRMAIEEALTKPSNYASGRKAIVDNYVYYRDGDSCQRVATWIANIAKTTQPGHPRGF
jgi:hypothetical protein